MFELHNCYFLDGKQLFNEVFPSQIIAMINSGKCYNRYMAFSSSTTLTDGNLMADIILEKPSIVVSYNADISAGQLYVHTRCVITESDLVQGSVIRSVAVTDGHGRVASHAYYDGVTVYSGGELICDMILFLRVFGRRVRLASGDNQLVRCMLGLDMLASVAEKHYVLNGGSYPAAFDSGWFKPVMRPLLIRTAEFWLGGKKALDILPNGTQKVPESVSGAFRFDGNYADVNFSAESASYSYFDRQPIASQCDFLENVLRSRRIETAGDFVMTVENGVYCAYRETDGNLVKIDTKDIPTYDPLDCAIYPDGFMIVTRRSNNPAVVTFKLYNTKATKQALQNTAVLNDRRLFFGGGQARIIAVDDQAGKIYEYDVADVAPEPTARLVLTGERNFVCTRVISQTSDASRIYVNEKSAAALMITEDGREINVTGELYARILSAKKTVLMGNYVLIYRDKLTVYDAVTASVVYESADRLFKCSDDYILQMASGAAKLLCLERHSGQAFYCADFGDIQPTAAVKVGRLMLLHTIKGDTVFQLTERGIAGIAPSACTAELSERIVDISDLEVCVRD